jgi:hypothetical protein
MTDNMTIAAVIVLLVLLALPTIRDLAGGFGRIRPR